MAKHTNKSKPTDTPTTRTPQICNSFSGNPGDPVQWQGVPAGGCTITAGDGTWPFNVGPPINLPSPSTVKIKSGLAAGTYGYNVSCCNDAGLKTVTVGG